MKILSIGREGDCTIILDDSMISRHHAILKIHATGKMEIVDMGQNGTFMNGVKLTPNIPYPVSRKDVISFAHVRQLDWSQVPDNFKRYRYIVLGILGIGLVTAIIAVVLNMRNPESEPPYIQENQPVEKVETEGMKEEGCKDSKEAEEVLKLKKKKEIPTHFPKKKEKKKGEEKKKPAEQKEADKANENENNIIM